MKILLVVLLLAIAMPCFAGINEMGGFAWTPVTKTYSTNGNVSGVTVWQPASGSRIILMGAILGTQDGAPPNTSIEIETGFDSTWQKDGTDVIPPINISSGEIVVSSGVPIWRGDVNGKLSVTTSKGCHPSVMLWGYETN